MPHPLSIEYRFIEKPVVVQVSAVFIVYKIPISG